MEESLASITARHAVMPAHVGADPWGAMASVLGAVEAGFTSPDLTAPLEEASRLLVSLVEEEHTSARSTPSGTTTLSYRSMITTVSASEESRRLSFLLATRIAPGSTVDVREEDSSVILLRVLDHADLPNAQEALRVRVENAQRVSGEVDKNVGSPRGDGPHHQPCPELCGRPMQGSRHVLRQRAAGRRSARPVRLVFRL